MTRLWAIGPALLLAGCLQAEPQAVTQKPADPSLQEPGCYTVDLFKAVKINPPPKGAPAEYGVWLGEWGNGVWNGKWCHDLLIHTVHADGRVEMLDMHAPSEEFHQPASIFKRTGYIQKDGSLQFAHGIVTRRYEFRDGLLYGSAEGGAFGKAAIILSRKGEVPLPKPRPLELAQAGLLPG